MQGHTEMNNGKLTKLATTQNPSLPIGHLFRPSSVSGHVVSGRVISHQECLFLANMTK